MNALKKLITLRPINTGKSENEAPNNNIVDEKPTYNSQGFEESIDSSGSPDILSSCLDDIYEKYREKCRIDEYEQNKLKTPYKEELGRKNNELDKLRTIKEIKELELSENENNIKKIDNDISRVKIEPEKYGIEANSKPKAQFYIGLLILIPLTIYLVVFYMSASYSAFFKNFESDLLSQAIFDANAFTKALKAGVIESIFVSTIPFAFMGLGYLIHMFQSDKKKGIIKIAVLIIVTFTFDLILAYQIEFKIYNLNRTLESIDFNFLIAIQKPEFWGIIFAGFVVYIIWGLVFDFIMKEYDNFDKINVYIKKLKEDKEIYLKEIAKTQKLVSDLKYNIIEKAGEIKEIRAKLDGFIFPKRKYLLLFTEYTKGWYIAIQKEIVITAEKKEKLITNCKNIANQHLKKKDLIKDIENTIYM